MENTKKYSNSKLTFYLVLAIATLIIAIIGATAAFFTASATSKKDVEAEAAIIKLNYLDDENISVSNLIPAREKIAIAGYQKEENQCLDDNNKVVCGVYRYSIENAGSYKMDVAGTLTVDKNEGGLEDKGFSNLSYIIYDVTDKDNIVVVKPTSVFSNVVGATTGIFGQEQDDILQIEAGATKNYEMLIWLNEAGSDNDKEQGAKFSASIAINMTDIYE